MNESESESESENECADTAVDADAIVDVRGLEKTYSPWSIRRRRRVHALRGVTLQASAGEVFGLLGPNGAGKTTLIKILLGVVKPSGGSAALFGQPAGSSSARRRVGYLPESLSIDSHHTARSALKFYGRLSGMSGAEINRRSDSLLELVGLKGRDRESVKRFSKGMRQRLGLAQALLHDPDLLVLDEPTDGLDPVGRSEVRRVIDQLRHQGKTIFLNSHILQEVELVCTRVAILSHGTIRGVGTLDEINTNVDSDLVKIQLSMPAISDTAIARETIRGCLGELAEDTSTQVDQRGKHDYRIEFRAESQSTVDGLVDRVRREGISIVRLEVKRSTLEDTFMKLVGPQQADPELSESESRSEVSD